jgi:hypothetical protein
MDLPMKPKIVFLLNEQFVSNEHLRQQNLKIRNTQIRTCAEANLIDLVIDSCDPALEENALEIGIKDEETIIKNDEKKQFRRFQLK